MIHDALIANPFSWVFLSAAGGLWSDRMAGVYSFEGGYNDTMGTTRSWDVTSGIRNI